MKQFQIILLTVTIFSLLISGCSQSDSEISSRMDNPPANMGEPAVTPTTEPPAATVVLTPTFTQKPVATLTPVSPDSPEALTTSPPLPAATAEPTETSLFVPLSEKPSPTPTLVANTSQKQLRIEWLITGNELDVLTEELGVTDWKLAAESPGEKRICRTFNGQSWSVSPDTLINCVHTTLGQISLPEVIDEMFEREYLFENEVLVESSLSYEDDFAVYIGLAPNGHTVIDLILLHDQLVFWVGYDMGTPFGSTPAENYASSQALVDRLLNEVVQTNLEMRETEPIVAEGVGASSSSGIVGYDDAADEDPTATPLSITQPSSTTDTAADSTPDPEGTPAATDTIIDERLGIQFDLPEDWLMEKRGDESCNAGTCPEVYLSGPHADGTTTSLIISAVAIEDLAALNEEMNPPDYEHQMVNSLPGRTHVGEGEFDILVFVEPGRAVRIAGQWQDSSDDLLSLASVLNSIEAAALVNAPGGQDENVRFTAIPLPGYGTSQITFKHPRSWQTSFFDDSGYFGWLISNVDPNEEFWSALSNGEELVLMILPVSDLSIISELKSNDWPKHYLDDFESAYAISETDVSGYALREGTAFGFDGSFPAGKMSEFEAGLVTIITSFGWEDLGEVNTSDGTYFGLRQEGRLETGMESYGYVPLASVSEWDFDGEEGQEIILTAGTFDPHLTLFLDVLDENDESMLEGSSQLFQGFISEKVKLPAGGTYHIHLYSPTIYEKLWPINPPAENKIFGWYKIILK